MLNDIDVVSQLSNQVTRGSVNTALTDALVPYSTIEQIITRLNSQIVILGNQAGMSSAGSTVALGEFAGRLAHRAAAVAVDTRAC